MPFFCDERRLIYPAIKRTKNNKKLYSLQARIPHQSKNHRNRKEITGKRAVPFASASMTVEAALVLPLFLFAGVILMVPFRILDVERQMQAIVDSVGEEISQAAYLMTGDVDERSGSAVPAWGGGGSGGVMEVMEGDKSSGTSAEKELRTTGAALAAYVYAEGAVRRKAAELPVERLSLAGSKILDDGETVNLIATYQMKLPFSVFSLSEVKRTNCCFLRAWVGGSGGTGDGTVLGGDTEDDPIVYVGRDSTRYHISASCHYLSNRLTAVAAEQAAHYRNKDGRAYTPCDRCGGQTSGTVYLMPSGRHYHSSPSCSAIQAYVTAVHLSEVEHLGPCSYCSGG